MAVRAAVAGASGYAGGEVLRLLLAHPEVEIGALTGNSNAGQRARRAAAAPAAAGRPGAPGDHRPRSLAGHDVVFLALPHGQSAAVAEQLGAGRARRRHAAPTSGSRTRPTGRRSTAPPHAGTWPYGLPELPGARAALQGTRRIAVPGCYPTAVSLALFPAYAAGLAEPEAVIVAASGTSGAGKAPKPHLLGSEVMGSMSPYGVGGGHRHTPEMIQNLSAAAGERVTRLLHPDPRPHVPRHPRHLHAPRRSPASTAESVRAAYEKALADEPFVHLLPEGQWPATASVYGSNAVQVQVALDEAARPHHRDQRHRQPHQGHRGRRGPEHEHRPRPPRGARDFPRSESLRERHGSQGIHGGGHRRRDQGERQPGPGPRGQQRAAPRRRRRLHLQPRQGRAGRCGPSRSSRAARSPPSSSTPVAPTPVRARRASRTPTPPPRRSPRCSGISAGEVAVASTGLIGLLLPMDKLLPGSRDAPPAELSEHGGEKAAIAIKTTDTVHKTAVVTQGRLDRRRHGQGRGHARPRPRHHARRPHHRRRPATAAALDTALRAATRTTFDRVDSDGCMSTNDTVLLLASGASGVTPEHAEFAEAVRTVCDDLGRQLIGDAEGASKDIQDRGRGRGERGRRRRGRPLHRPQQPPQVRHPRRGPQLGPGALRDRHHHRRLRARPAQRRHQRRLGLQERRRSARTATWSTCATARCTSPPTSPPGSETAVIWANDLTADYVHENSAYSS